MAKTFAVLEGIQGGTVLSGRVQIDEKYYPVSASEMILNPDGSRLRGFSRNNLCIALGVQEKGPCFAEGAGRGKPSNARALQAYAPHIAPGSTLVHDKERSHAAVVANRLCFLLETLLNSHSGFERGDLQGYLNLFAVMMNPPDTKMEKAALVLDRAMRCTKTLQYREFYAPKQGKSNTDGAKSSS